MKRHEEDSPLLWHQVEAFRELLQEGAQLLGEVLAFTKNAEESLAALDREKAALDEERQTLREAKETACREVQTANGRMELLQEEVAALQEELNRVKSQQAGATISPQEGLASLHKALREAEERGHSLDRELRELKLQLIRPDRVEEGSVDEETRLKSLEQELERTRLILASERLRRNRAISLIRPTAGQETLA